MPLWKEFSVLIQVLLKSCIGACRHATRQKIYPSLNSYCSTLVLPNAFKPVMAGLINNETLTGSVIFKSGILVYGGNPDCHKYTHQLFHRRPEGRKFSCDGYKLPQIWKFIKC